MSTTTRTDIKEVVKEKYGHAALRVAVWKDVLPRWRFGAGRKLRPDHIEAV